MIQPTKHTSVVYTDASGTGFGAVSEVDWLCGQWQDTWMMDVDIHGHCRPVPTTSIPDNINVRELYPILESIWRWGDSWRNHKVECVTDNTQVVAAINTGRSSNEASMCILRDIFWQSVVFNCHLVARHLPGKDNTTADILSRMKSVKEIPFFLCCSRNGSETSVRFPGCGVKGSGMGTEFLED